MVENKDKNASNGDDMKREILTTRQGHPVRDNQNIRTIGNRGPATLENYHFVEKISHFDREEVPERVRDTHEDLGHLAILKRTEKLGMNQWRSILVLKYFRVLGREHH